MLDHLPVALQAFGVVAVLVGLFVLLPVGAAVLIGGGLLAVVGIALEASSGPSARRDGPNPEGGE